MTETKQITEAQVSWESDHEQYWQGHGISFSSFDECSTGVGSTLSEAFDDCLESLAQNDIRLSDEREAALLADLASQVKDPSMIDMDITTAECSAQGEHVRACPHSNPDPAIHHEDVDHNTCAYCAGTGEVEDENPDCSVCAGEWHFYVSIDVKFAESGETR